MALYTTPAHPLVTVLSSMTNVDEEVILEAMPFLEHVYTTAELNGEDIDRLQSWCVDCSRPYWCTGVGLMEAADHMVQEAVGNGNIEGPEGGLQYTSFEGFEKRRFQRVYAAALKWQRQGKRSKWTTRPSVDLWDTVEKTKAVFENHHLKPNRRPMQCWDCSAHDAGYMVKKEVWREAFPEYKQLKDELVETFGAPHYLSRVLLCFDCLEKRLGRSLVEDDFTPAPINNPIRLGMRLAKERV